MNDESRIIGTVHAVLTDKDGNVKGECTVHNLITSVGDQMYAARGSGIASPPAAPTGMRIGTGSTAVAKSGAGAAIGTKITGGNQGFDATYPQASGGVVTYKTTYGAGVGTTASAVTEAVLVNDTIATDTATAAANTIARVLLTGIGSKGAQDTLAITWTHTLLGA
jgi:hypothetical protein